MKINAERLASNTTKSTADHAVGAKGEGMTRMAV
jgi:hypothetical protein